MVLTISPALVGCGLVCGRSSSAGAGFHRAAHLGGGAVRTGYARTASLSRPTAAPVVSACQGLDDHERLGVRMVIGQAEGGSTRRHARRGHRHQPLGRAAGQGHGRLARAQVDHAHVAPEDAAPEAGAQRLGAGLLGGEPLGVACGAVGLALRARALDLGEDALDETLAEALQRLFDAADVGEVRADADDQAAASRASRAAPGAR